MDYPSLMLLKEFILVHLEDKFSKIPITRSLIYQNSLSPKISLISYGLFIILGTLISQFTHMEDLNI
ncbi:MAG: hypothetical protein COA94_07735 [Rickettsiales bacterium]|nr:MAG: hypothetical protein COA94_07735 [Rickettsiales bacterium]